MTDFVDDRPMPATLRQAMLNPGLDPQSPHNRHITLDSRTIFYPEMKPEDVRLEEIPHCLSYICRYNGFVHFFYSVAQHSVLTCELAERVHGRDSPIARACLMHDAVEAYLGDVSRPTKVCIPDFIRLEAHVEDQMAIALGLPRDEATKKEVTRFDIMALNVEASGPLLFHRYAWVKDVPKEEWEHSDAARFVQEGIEVLPGRAKAMMEEKMKDYGFQA